MMPSNRRVLEATIVALALAACGVQWRTTSNERDKGKSATEAGRVKPGSESSRPLPSRDPAQYFDEIENHPAYFRHIDPPATGSLSAESCAKCHPVVYDEWKSSMLAHATRDPFFLAKQLLVATSKKFTCKRCHTQLENQVKALVTGIKSVSPLKPAGTMNPGYDERLAEEGVTCVVCHMSPEAAFWPETPPESVTSGNSPPVFGARSLPDAAAPHAIQVGPALEEPGRLCGVCHRHGGKRQSMIFGANNPDVFRQQEEYRKNGGKENCVSCHMPAIERVATNNQPPRMGHDHSFPGVLGADLLKKYVRASVEIFERGAKIELENLAGHDVPTLISGRTLRLVTELRNADRLVASRVARITIPNRLRLGERRTINVPFARLERLQASTLVLTMEMERFEADDPVALLAKALFDVPESARKTTFSVIEIKLEKEKAK